MIDNHIPGFGSLKDEINMLLDEVAKILRKKHLTPGDTIKLENLMHQVRYRANKELS